jgi:hemolysin activation/secretion protein
MSNVEKRLAELEGKLQASELRIAQLERKHEEWEQRRAKILPPEIFNDPNVTELAADYAKKAVEGWRQCIRTHGVSLEQARFADAQRKKMQELEDKARAEKFSEAAELAAVTKFYQTHGYLPTGCGFEIVEDDFENSSSASLQRWE